MKKSCPKCGGFIFMEDKEEVCVNCGYRKEFNRPDKFIDNLTEKTRRKYRIKSKRR